MDGEYTRRLMYISGDGDIQQATIRALTFKDGQSDAGGGLAISGLVKLEVVLCIFTSCTATGPEGGGAIHYDGTAGAEVNIYATRFLANTATSSGADIYRKAGLMTVRTTCPSPYESFLSTAGDALTTYGTIEGTLNTHYCYFMCPAGFYNDELGVSSSSCQNCAQHEYSDEGSTYCSFSQWQVTNIAELFSTVSQSGTSKMAGETFGSDLRRSFDPNPRHDSRRWGRHHDGRANLPVRNLRGRQHAHHG